MAVFNGKDRTSKKPTQYLSVCLFHQMANVGGKGLLSLLQSSRYSPIIGGAMSVQLSPSLPHLHSSVHTTLFPLHEHLCEHFDFSELHLTSCSTETGACATRERTGTSFWSRYLHPKVSGSRQVWLNTLSWCNIIAWTWARRICSVHAPWVGGSLSTLC